MKEFGRTLLVFTVFLVLTGLVYPFAMTELAHWFFPKQAEGSLITSGDRVVGSSLIGQKFVTPRYFHSRPSANDYDATNSGGVNLGPDSRKLIADVSDRAKLVRGENSLPPAVPIPAGLVLTSASGLDPHISLEGALIQARRIAQARHVSEDEVKHLIEKMNEGSGLLGPGRVNVLELNVALDSLNK